MAAGETTVGGIVGFLRLDDDQFNRAIDEAIARIRLLNGQDVDIDIRVDTHDADRDLDRVDEAMRRTTRSNDNMGNSFRRLRGFNDPRVILAAIAGGVAVLGPVAGATTAAVAGLTGVVATGALAWKGYQSEIQNGTVLGKQLQGELGGLSATLHVLESTAANAMGPGLIAGLQRLDDFLPSVDGSVSELGKSLGNALNITADGVVSGLQTMMPLLVDGGHYAEQLAQGFADFTQSQDFKDFIDYARTELPEVAEAVGTLVKGIVDLTVALEPVGDAMVKVMGQAGDLASHVSDVLGPVISQSKDFVNWIITGKKPWDDQAAAADNATVSLQAVDAAITSASAAAKANAVDVGHMSTAYGVTVSALAAAQAAQEKQTGASQAATLQMQLENDAAGLLKQALDSLNGEAIDAASAQNAFDSSLANMGDHVTAQGKKIHFTTTSINNMSAASVALRGQLIQQVQNAQRVIEANGGMTDSTGKVTEQAKKLRKQIIDNAVAHGVDRKAAQEFIDTIFKYPKKVPPTKLDVDKKAAEEKLAALKAHLLATARNYTATVTVETIGVGRYAGKKVPTSAVGGTVGGNGGPTADDQLTWLSTGEEVINARSAKKHRALLKALNADKFAAGGTVGMATGGTVSSRINAQFQKAIRLPDASGVQKASDAITRLLAAWQKSIDDADAAARRLELVRAVAKASRKDVAAAKKDLADFDRQQAQERVKDAAARKQELLASRAQILANRQQWAFDHMSTADQLKNITKRLNAEKAYTDEWMSLAQQREQVVSSMNDRLNQMLDQQADINSRLAQAEATRDSAIASANQSLADQTQQLKDTRREALATWASLTEQAQVGFAPSMGFLVANAKDQVQQFTEWMSQLALARSRGLSENAIALLGLDQGPQALAQLRQVNKGTADQVDQLNALVAQRNQLAQQQTDLEARNQLGQLGQDLLAAQQQAAQAIAQAQADFLAAQQELTAELAAVGTDQARSYTDAIAEGLLSGLPAIQAAAAQVQAALTAMQATQAALDAAGKKSTKKPTVKRAGGGWVFGPGSSTSDSIDAALSNGEFVVNAAAASRNAGLLTALNAGQTVSPIVPRINVAAPVVHVTIDGQALRHVVRLELGRAQRDAQLSERRTVSV